MFHRTLYNNRQAVLSVYPNALSDICDTRECSRDEPFGPTVARQAYSQLLSAFELGFE